LKRHFIYTTRFLNALCCPFNLFVGYVLTQPPCSLIFYSLAAANMIAAIPFPISKEKA
jgi:hypothetical protein